MLLTIQFQSVDQGYKYNIVPFDPGPRGTPVVFYGNDHTEERLKGALLIQGVTGYLGAHPAMLWHELQPYREFIVLESSILVKWFHRIVNKPTIDYSSSERTKYLQEIRRMYSEVMYPETYETSLIKPVY